jgi:hypothetical protein
MGRFVATDIPGDLPREERALFVAYSAGAELANHCAVLREAKTPTGDCALELVIVSFATDLWDRGFSAAAIRKALKRAICGVGRYAARASTEPEANPAHAGPL